MRSRAASAAVSALVLATALAACSTSTATSGTTSSPASPSPAAHSMASPTPSTVGGMSTFTSTSPAYSFQYPSSWRKEEGTSSHPVTLSPESGPNWVELTLDKVHSGTTLDAYRPVYRKQAAQWGFTVVATHPATMGGQPALVIESTKMNAMILSRTAAFFTISGDCAYMLTLNGPDDSFDADYQTLMSMAESFGFGG